jgi:RNA polymerase sigma-70 factor, ECF subfamily
MARQSLALQHGIPADSARIAELVRDHLTFVWRSLRRLGLSVAEADDATQQVMLTAARRLEEVLPGRERPFLFASALRIASSTRRKLDRRRETDIGETLPDPGPDPEALVEQRRARALLDSVLETLPLDLRAVFVLYEIEELTVPEIGRVLELKIGTVASRLRRAREEFAAAVRRIEGDLP